MRQVQEVGGAAAEVSGGDWAGRNACTTQAGLKACTTTSAREKTIADERAATRRHYSKGARRGVMAVRPQTALRFASALVLIPAAALAQPAAGSVRFTRDIAPIFQNKCEACHRADSMAPRS